jgi:hypothetical protein
MPPRIGRTVERELHVGDLVVTESLTTVALTINGQPIEATTLVVAEDDVADLNGEKLIIDADQDTYIRQTGGPGGTDDSFDIYVAGALDFSVAANLLTAKSGSVIATNTISETTAASGVTVDGVLLKDGGAVFADAATIEIDTINEATAAAGVTIDSVLAKDGGIRLADGAAIAADVVSEKTAAAGVTIDGLLVKDGGVGAIQAITGDGAITIQTGRVYLSKAGAGAITIAAPTATTHDYIEITVITLTAQAHVITSGVEGFNDKGSSGTVTFTAAIGNSVTLVAYQGNWYTVVKNGVTVA